MCSCTWGLPFLYRDKKTKQDNKLCPSCLVHNIEGHGSLVFRISQYNRIGNSRGREHRKWAVDKISGNINRKCLHLSNRYNKMLLMTYLIDQKDVHCEWLPIMCQGLLVKTKTGGYKVWENCYDLAWHLKWCNMSAVLYAGLQGDTDWKTYTSQESMKVGTMSENLLWSGYKRYQI